MATIDVRPLVAADAAEISGAFTALGWLGKSVGLYQRYLDEQAAGRRTALVASCDGGFAGYLTVRWSSDYRPFREAGIPEIQDLNVLPRLRRRRVASALMDAAEALIGDGPAGIGVGLTADYAAAHLMYLRRGYLPDGRGIAYRSVTVGYGTPVPVDDDLALMLTLDPP